MKTLKIKLAQLHNFFKEDQVIDLNTFIIQSNNLKENQTSKEKFATLLYDEYYVKIYNYFFNSTKNRQTAEEETQETLLKIYNKIEQYDSSKSKLSTWIWTIARNHLIDFFRLKENKVDFTIFEEEHQFDVNNEDTSSAALLALIENEENQNIQYALNKLPPASRDTLLIWLESDLSMDEIAKIQNTKVQNVKNHLFQAKKKLKELLTDIEK